MPASMAPPEQKALALHESSSTATAPHSRSTAAIASTCAAPSAFSCRSRRSVMVPRPPVAQEAATSSATGAAAAAAAMLREARVLLQAAARRGEAAAAARRSMLFGDGGGAQCGGADSERGAKQEKEV